MGLFDYIRKVAKAFSNSDSYYRDFSKEDEEQLKEAEKIREQEAREAYLKTPEGQEEFRKGKVARLKHNINITKDYDIGEVSEKLENLLEIAKEDEIEENYVHDCIYSAGKRAAAIVYDEKGANPDNIEQVVEDVAESYKKLLDKDIDKDEFAMYVHKNLIEDLLQILRDLPESASIADAENVVKQVNGLLDFTDYSEKEKDTRKTNLQRLLGSNYLKHMEKLAKKGDADDFDHYKEKLFEALNHTENTALELANIRLSVDKFRVMCYKENYTNTVVAFGNGDIPIAELEQCIAKNNKTVKESLMPERLKHRYLRALSPNAYREEIDRLIYNFKFVENKSQFRNLSKEIRRCIKPAKLDKEERAHLEKTLRNINAIFKRIKKPVPNIKKNPNFKRQVKTKLDNIQSNLEEIANEDDCFKKDKSLPNSMQYKELKGLLDSAVLNNGHRRPPTKKEIVRAISKVESRLFNPEYRENLYLDEVWSLQLKIDNMRNGDTLKKDKNKWGQNGNQKNTDKRRIFDRRMQRFTKKSR